MSTKRALLIIFIIIAMCYGFERISNQVLNQGDSKDEIEIYMDTYNITKSSLEEDTEIEKDMDKNHINGNSNPEDKNSGENKENNESVDKNSDSKKIKIDLDLSDLTVEHVIK